MPKGAVKPTVVGRQGVAGNGYASHLERRNGFAVESTRRVPQGFAVPFLRVVRGDRTGMILSCVIADDSLVLQKKYAVALTRARDFRLREVVSSGPELEGCLDRGSVHLVLLDIYLKGWNGLHSLRQARMRHPRVDWLILSHGVDPDTVRGCVCLGVFDYLIKPFSIDRLEKALDAFHQYHQGLTQRTNPWHQKDLDMLFSLRGRFSGSQDEAPKGIQSKLLERLRICMAKEPGTLSASQAGYALGISRSTARRYMEYLVENGEATVEHEISSVGRPVKLYRLSS